MSSDNLRRAREETIEKMAIKQLEERQQEINIE